MLSVVSKSSNVLMKDGHEKKIFLLVHPKEIKTLNKHFLRTKTMSSSSLRRPILLEKVSTLLALLV